MIRALLKSVREYKLPTFLSMLFIIGEVCIEIFIPFITKDLINDINNEIFDNIYIYALKLIILALLSLSCGVLSGLFCSKAAVGFGKNLRSDLYDKVQTFSFENIDKFSAASLVTRMTTDVQNVQFSYMMIIRTAIRAPLVLIFSTIMAFSVGGKLGLIFVLVIPIIGFGLFLIARTAMPRFDKVFVKYDNFNNSIQENINGIRVVKSYVREEYETVKFEKTSNELYHDFVRAERIVAFNAPLMNFSMYMVSSVVCVLGSIICIKATTDNPLWGLTLDVGSLSTLLTYGIQALMSLMMLAMIFVIVSISFAGMKRIVEVLREEPTITNNSNPIMEVNDGSIDFRNVSFKYSEKAERNALNNINLHIDSGKTVGIIGGTGSSKTTLIQLISRIYDATSGEVYVGGVNVKDYDLEVLRNNVSVVLQKNLLFSGTVMENLRWGNEQATDEEVYEACKIAQADEFIRANPEGYNKVIERGGVNVSGGQKQRICIARALLKKPKIIIFDDSTSAVDTKTDRLIREGLANNIPDVTKIIIAQRIASVESADMIIVMDNGEINQVGTHDELIRTNAIYQEVYETQKQVGGIGNE